MASSEKESQASNQQKLRALIEDLGVTQKEVAEILTRETKRPVGYRAVKTWLGKPELKSSRPCPEWPIEILQKEVSNI